MCIVSHQEAPDGSLPTNLDLPAQTLEALRPINTFRLGVTLCPGLTSLLHYLSILAPRFCSFLASARAPVAIVYETARLM